MLFALHALWSSSSLYLWGEDGEARMQRRKAPGSQSVRPPSRHPFAADPVRLREFLGQESASAAEAEVTLVLPTAAGRPLLSPSLASRVPAPRAVSRLALWRVPALALAPGPSVDALLALSDGSLDGTIGDSVRALTRVAEFGLDLVARGRVLPGIVRGHEDRQVARWLPAPTGEDDELIRRLAESLPPSCRCESVDGSRDGPDPRRIISQMLGAVVDGVARAAAANHRLLPARRRPISTGEAFVAALGADDPALMGDPEEIEKLRRALVDWRNSGIRHAGPVRTCFRLVAPDDGDTWSIEFLLQSREDPSLLVPAERVWRARRRVTVLERTIEHPQERLLADLGHANRLYPDLERALEGAHPDRVETDAAGAHRFLAEAAPLLEQAGFGVFVPPWWRSRKARLSLRVRARAKQTAGAARGLLGLDGICDYRYEVALGDETLSAADLRRLAKLKIPLVRVRGQWVELRAGDIGAALRALQQGNAQATAGTLLRQGLGLEPSPSGIPVIDVRADGWLGELLAADRKLEPIPTPKGFRGSLRPYQERGLAWLAFLDAEGLGACLADDMGLGKTIQLLALLLAERERNREPRKRLPPTLLICPMSVVGNWQREAERFAPGLDVHVHHGGDRLGGGTFTKAARASDLVITTYGLAARDADVLGGIRWGRVVLDEAQNIKNAEAKQSRAVRALRAPRRITLTGTPVENRLAELWSIMEFCNPGLLGSARGFRERFAVPIERFRDEEAADRLKRITGPFVLRRLKSDRSIIADLPDKIEMKVYCNLTREQATLYQAVVDDMLARIEESEGMERRGLVLATMVKLKQVCNHPAHLLGDGSSIDGRSGKLRRIEEILDEALAEGDRALCFTQFTEMGHLLRDHLARRFGTEIPFLHGGVPKRARDQIVARFQSETGPRVLLLSLKAGGVGLNLTAANHVIHFDRWWNPAVEDQATDRAFRIGQKRNVQVRKLVCIGTLEERIDAMIEEKRDLAKRIVGTGEGWITELSTKQLRELVALSADAVAEA